MIAKENLQEILIYLGFTANNKNTIFKKTYQNNANIFIEVDFNKGEITYAPLDSRFKEGEYPSIEKQSTGFVIHKNTTTNFSSNENFVCLIAIDKLLSKGYGPKHIILEPTFKVGHNQQVYGDILVLNQQFENLILIENKTYGAEFSKEWNLMLKNGGQLFSYYAVNKTDFLCLLAFDYEPSLKSLIYTSHIITTKDNQKHLEIINADLKEEDKKLGFEDSKNANAKDYYKVWNESYSLAYTSKGLFEEDILPYKIGKEKYTLKDLSVVPYSEISGIYHSFATILRNNAIGNYENTFYILVDLFLCKIIDEIQNSQDLQFYYKGIFYDNPFSYCDRLLNLYEKGIETLFKKKVVNVQKSEIDHLFESAKRHKGKFKESIEKIFDKQKYFNIKKFNFIEVENEEEFFINFKVLVQITNLIQDFYISKSENNQFLGDLFEGFLNRAVHQTEGRFFTPTPITNFIINSLPTLSNNAKILDFACGAGHFLTEFIAHNQNAKLYGIEKNKDLSKVAKTACIFHNPESKSQIIFQDALDFIKENYKDEFENESFDLILSNPPYSVKGFLSNLDKALNAFSLSQSIDSKSYDKNNAIECFFVERAKQFLKEGGYFALILPVSILQKGGIYEKTRELLLAHFKLLCLVELNSRTFGSTGTQTIILFAKRVKKYDEDLISRLKDSNFSDEALSDDFNDENFLKNYCEFMGYDYESFKKFMRESILEDNLKNSSIFKEYLADYESSKPKVFKKQKLSENDKKALFEKSSFFKDLDSKTHKKQYGEFLKSDAYNKAEENLRFQNFLNQVKDLECEKMLYFAYIKDEKVLILKSPSDKNKEGKSNKANIVKFLGYDWSNRKGDEGIKYITNKPIDSELKESDEDSDEEKKQKEVLRNINSVKFIQTPLYNPSDKEDSTKLAYALKSFMEQDSNNTLSLDNLLESLQSNEQDSYTLFSTQCKDLLDFSRVEFSKAISLNPKNLTIFSNPFENSQFELVKLGALPNLTIAKGKSITQKQVRLGNIKVVAGGIDYAYLHDTSNRPKDTITISASGANAGFVNYWNEEIFASDCTTINSDSKLDIKFIYYVLRFIQKDIYRLARGAAQPHVYPKDIEQIEIPLPPLEIQKQIVNECEKVEEQYNTIRMSIEEYQKLIKAILVKCGICEADTAQSTNSVGGGGNNLSFSSLDSIDIFIAQILAHIAELESKLDFEFLQSLNAEVTNKESLTLDSKEFQNILNALPIPPKEGWERKRLSDKTKFSLSIGKRVLDSELNPKGNIPVYSANVKKPFGFIDKEILKDYTNESVLWGIDGDWLVSFMPKNTPFYPTDHCGVLRVNGGEAKLIAYILGDEGERAGFSRTLRASIERIAALKIIFPPLKSQQQIVNVIENIESHITHLDSITPLLESKKQEILLESLM